MQSPVDPPRLAVQETSDTEELKMRLSARQASPAYQQMLVCLRHVVGCLHFYLCIMPQAQRNSLPIAKYREEIISILETSQVMVLSGETGW